MDAVTLADVAVAFHLSDDAHYTAVDRLSLRVIEGEFVAIVGPTGCGKSTLLNVTAGLLAPSTGQVAIFGAPLTGLNRSAGYLFQSDALFPWKTALENVAIGLETAGTARTKARKLAEAWLVRGMVNLRRDGWRKERVRTRHDQEIRRSPRTTGDGEAALVARATVWRALDLLAPRRRAIVVMYELEGMPIASIASLLGISAITVRWHLSVGRRELARLLESHGGAHDHR